MSRLLVLFLLTACVTADPIEGLQTGIINGSTTTGQPWTVAVYNSGRSGTGGLCSGTLIGDYAVLTAKHCVFQEQPSGGWAAVPPSELLIIVGTDIQTAGGIAQTSNVYEVRSTPGVYTDADLESGSDLAVILLPAPFVDVAPQTAARSSPSVGVPATIVGFGRNDPGTDDSGVKYIGDTAIAEVGSRLIRAAGRSWTCQGDSGGPLLVGSTVHGVTSFGVGGCGARSLHYFTNVASHTALIDDALAWRPPCDAEPERCDGVDNDCNGLIDEGCTALGEACTAATDCGDGRCEDLGAGRVCVRTCDPRSAVPRCPFGFHCEATGCGEGACIEGGEGPRADGDECTSAADCDSRRCIDVAGTMRCSRQCDPSAGDCGIGNLCETASGCGDCVPVELSTSPRPFGSPCDVDAQCSDFDCTVGEGAAPAFCTRSCGATSLCPGGYHCRSERCVAGDLAGLGEGCTTVEDCDRLDCVEVDGDRFCAGECGAACVEGFECTPTAEGERCVPGGSALGEPCAAGSECRTGICAGTCTRICDDTPCPTGFDCRPAGAVSGCFPAAEPPAESGGCTASGSGGSGALASAALLAVLVPRRRRK